MRRIIIRTLFAALLVLSGQQAWGFAFLGPLAFGPDAAWQTVALGYLLPYTDFSIPGGPVYLGDIGLVKNIGEEYRRNDTVIFYAYDSTFQGYFGLQGETNADLAFTTMNNFFGAHTNGVDGYSTNLAEFPFNTQHFNGMAEGLYLTDLKSVILHLLVEQMGLAQPERYTWTLHDRVEGGSPPPCPLNVSYLVVQRNFNDVDQPLTGPQSGTIYSPYVNNLLYSYGIAEDCNHHPPAWTAVTIPFSTDTTSPQYTAVAANNFEGGVESGLGGLQIGGFYAGLTEDDATGLRYLMSSNNVQYEIPATGSQLEVTNNFLLPLTTKPLGPLLQFAQTNPPAAVLALDPSLVIDSVSNYFTLVTNPIIASYFTNFPGSQFGSLPVFFVFTNGYTYNWQTNYVYTFGNMVIFQYFSNTPAQLQTISLAFQTGQQYPSPPVTNITYKNIVLTNQPSGQYYTVPTNSCGFEIAKTNALNVFAGTYTNEMIATATNTTSTGIPFFVGSESIIEKLTNSFLQYYQCNFATSGPAYYQGIQRVQFVRVSDSNLDPLTRVFRQPVTNLYTMTTVTNGTRFKQTFFRIAVAPDIILTAFDDAQPNTFNGTVTRSINFETAAAQPGLSGPGIIDGQSQFAFNKVGTAWWNGPFPDTNSFLVGQQSEVNPTTAIPSLMWASFDGSTNPPIVYPTGASIQELINQMVISIQPTSLPPGTNNIQGGSPYPYDVQFSASGGTGPNYTWSGTNFPNGLSFDGGTLHGFPTVGTNTGTYDITIQVTDSSNPPKTVTMPLSLTIYPNPNN